MTPLRVVLFRVAGFFGLFRDDTEIRGEVETHVEMLAEQNMQRGMNRDEAWAEARRSFGGVEQVMETYRDQRGLPTLGALLQDARYSVRSLARTPLFTGIALLTIVVAVAANGTLFSLLNAMLLRDLAVRDPSTLVQVAAVTPEGTERGLSYAMFEELAQQQQAFTQVMGWWGTSVMKVESDRGLARAVLFGATPNLFSDLGVEPHLGRVLQDADMRLGRPYLEHVVVLGYDFWRRHFNADPLIVGRAVKIEGIPFTVVGVTSPAFSGIRLTQAPELIVPLLAVQEIQGNSLEAIPTGPAQWIRVLARRGPDVTLAQVRAQLEVLWPAVIAATVPASFAAEQRREFRQQHVAVASAARGIEPQLRAQFTQPLLIVLGIAGLVLLIACVNLANLLLARTAARGHEIATRLALGATVWRVSRQIVLESVLLSLVGGGIAVLVSWWASDLLSGVIFADYLVASSFNSAPDWRVVVGIVAVSVATGILFSLAAVWWVARRPSTEALRTSRTVASTGRAGAWLVGAQVALSLILVIHAGLLVRSLGAVRAVETGVDTRDVLVTFTTDRPGGYKAVDNATYYPQLIERLNAIPGVIASSVSLLKPGGGGGGRLEGVRVAGAVNMPAVDAIRTPVAPRFFATLGITLLSGRDFTWSDTTTSQPVALLSASLAARLFSGGDGLGSRVNVGSLPRLQNVEIVGVVADSRLYDPKDGNTDAVYVPALQDPNASYKCLVIRGDSVSPRDVQQAVESLGYELISAQQSLNDITSRTLLRERLTAAIGGFFGLLAIALAAIGLYGLMAYTVSQRRREAGVRLALGAAPGQIMRAVLRHAVYITLSGVAVGTLLGFASVGALNALLFGISAHDPATFIAASLLMTAVALLAVAGPALRLGRTDPLIALRES